MRMLKVLIPVLVALSVLAAPVGAAPTASGDSVSGSGYRLNVDGEKRVQFTVSAKSTPSGGASGSYSYNHLVIPLTFSGPVTCLDVDGNQAAVGGLITKVTDPDNWLGEDSYGFLVFFIDDGSPYRGQIGPDTLSQTYIYPVQAGDVDFGGDFPSTCPDAAETAHDLFDMRGNVTVKDFLGN